jgi:hypothetical protein
MTTYLPRDFRGWLRFEVPVTSRVRFDHDHLSTPRLPRVVEVRGARHFQGDGHLRNLEQAFAASSGLASPYSAVGTLSMDQGKAEMALCIERGTVSQ